MSLVIRFAKTGRRGEEKYRIVVKEKRSKRDGAFIDLVGHFEKRIDGSIIKKIDRKKLNYWVSHGAQINSSVQKII